MFKSLKCLLKWFYDSGNKDCLARKQVYYLFEVITKILCVSYECVSQIGVRFGAEQDENELTITTKW